MKILNVSVAFIISIILVGGWSGCGKKDTADDIQRQQQEVLLKEGTSQTGMPAIKNFRERKLLKDILELRDEMDLVTYTYLENVTPTVIPGYTALGGKLTYLGQTVGYGIPYATQYTNPMKIEYRSDSGSRVSSDTVLPNADPNGLFSPGSAEGTWVMMRDPSRADSDVKAIYVEPRTIALPFKLPMDDDALLAKLRRPM